MVKKVSSVREFKLHREVLPHPPYSPGFTFTGDFLLFAYFKGNL